MNRRRALQGAAGLVLPSWLGRSFAQGKYPSKPVKLIIPFAAGQGSDILARAMSDKLSAMWGQPVIVESHSGANGSLAAQYVAHAAPDGHTLLMTSNSPIVINPNLYQKLPYNVEHDLRPVLQIATTDLVLSVHPSLPVKDVAEFVAYVRANPDKLSYGSIGAGSTSHLCMEAFKRATNTSMVHVPYKGSAPALTDLMAGTVQAMIDGFPSSVPHVRSGRIKALAVTGRNETAFLPGVPTLASTVAPGYDMGGWYGLMAPAATDLQIIRKLATDFAGVADDPQIAQRLVSIFVERAKPATPDGFGDLIRRETAMWGGIVKVLGLRLTD